MPAPGVMNISLPALRAKPRCQTPRGTTKVSPALTRVRRLPDFVEQVRPFLDDRVGYDQEAVLKYLTTADLHQHIEALAVGLGNVQSWEIGRAHV